MYQIGVNMKVSIKVAYIFSTYNGNEITLIQDT